MAKTKRIGLIFSYDEEWVAGAYYIMNLVHALKTLPVIKQPHLVFYIKNEQDHLIVKQLKYLSYKVVFLNSPLNFFKRAVNVLYRMLNNENRFLNFPNKFDLDLVFPYKFDYSLTNQKLWTGRLFWIPDLQEVFLPQLFSKEELEFRKSFHHYIVNHNCSVVFSSNNALSHFQQIYGARNNKEFVLNFAVTHPSFNHLDKSKIMEKFGIKRPFYFSPNQFWVHKNHMIILQALVSLKQTYQEILIVFSGKESDYRNPDYFNSIKRFVHENNLQNNVLFLGFIDRAEQLVLIRESLAVIQPSLFEGWSTVVEDAKALDKFIIASNIEVHQEQLSQNFLLFDPKSKDDFIEKIVYFKSKSTAIIPNNYENAVRKFGQDFMKIVEEI